MNETQNKSKEKTYFSGKMKLAELIDINYNLLGLLPRLGVNLGLGAQSIEYVCADCSLDVDTFLLICNVYTYDEYVPSSETLAKCSVKDIVKYLHSSHDYYLSTALVTLAESIDRLLESCSEKQKAVIWKFFVDYKTEVAGHFEYEEKTLFPYVEMLLHGQATEDFSIAQFEEHHSNIEEKLDDLKNIVMMYLPSVCDNTRIGNVLFFIYYLEQDLARHTRIEDNILVPIVSRIEDNGRQ